MVHADAITNGDMIMPLVLSLLAGLSTCLGAAVVFCARCYQHRTAGSNVMTTMTTTPTSLSSSTTLTTANTWAGKPSPNNNAVVLGHEHLAFALSLAGSVMLTVSVASILPESFAVEGNDNSSQIQQQQQQHTNEAETTTTTTTEGEPYEMVAFGSREFMERCVSFGVGCGLYILLSKCAFPEPEEIMGWEGNQQHQQQPAADDEEVAATEKVEGNNSDDTSDETDAFVPTNSQIFSNSTSDGSSDMEPATATTMTTNNFKLDETELVKIRTDRSTPDEYIKKPSNFKNQKTMVIKRKRCERVESNDSNISRSESGESGAADGDDNDSSTHSLNPLLLPSPRSKDGHTKKYEDLSATSSLSTMRRITNTKPTSRFFQLSRRGGWNATCCSRGGGYGCGCPSSASALSSWQGSDLTTPEARRSWRVAMLLFVSLAVHNFPEGLAVAASTIHSQQLGITTAVAIALHNIPEGIAIAVPCLAARPDAPWLAFCLASVSGLAEPLGAAVAVGVLQQGDRDNAPSWLFNMNNVLAFVAGIMIMVAVRELFPEAQRHSKETQVPFLLGTLSGMVVMLASDAVLNA